MIDSQQFILPNLSQDIPQKFSLKTKRVISFAQKTKRTLSFHYSNQEDVNISLRNLKKEQCQISTKNGMFRYCKVDKSCFELQDCGKMDLLQNKMAKQNKGLLNYTAQGPQSSFSTEDRSKRRSEDEKLLTNVRNCGKNSNKINTQDRIDNIRATDLMMEPLNFKDFELISNKTKSSAGYGSATDRHAAFQNLNQTKFSLKKLRSYGKNSEKIQSEQFHNQQINQIRFKEDYAFQSQKSQPGCLCLPQCFWINKWQKLIKANFHSKSSIKDPKKISKIQTDLNQTHHLTYFNEAENKNCLKEVLVNYISANPHVSYVQGMSVVASVIVYHSKDVTQSSAILNLIMKQKQFEKIYEKDLTLSWILAKEFKSQLKKYQPKVFNHIVKSNIEMQAYVKGWYFSMLGCFVPFESMHLVVDKFVKKGFNGINELLLSLFIDLKKQILAFSREEVANLFTVDWLSKRCLRIDWLQIMGFSENISLNILSP